jgi:hypothetical protein
MEAATGEATSVEAASEVVIVRSAVEVTIMKSAMEAVTDKGVDDEEHDAQLQNDLTPVEITKLAVERRHDRR